VQRDIRQCCHIANKIDHARQAACESGFIFENGVPRANLASIVAKPKACPLRQTSAGQCILYQNKSIGSFRLVGRKASGTSKRTELKLTDVARTSLGELLRDYRDFLRTRKLRVWDKDSREAQYLRRLEQDFLKHGDMREYISRARKRRRQ